MQFYQKMSLNWVACGFQLGFHFGTMASFRYLAAHSGAINIKISALLLRVIPNSSLRVIQHAKTQMVLYPDVVNRQALDAKETEL